MRTLTLFFILFLFFPTFLHAMPPDSIAVYLAQAEDCKRGLQYDKALSLYQKLYKKNPNNLDYLVACAETQILMGKDRDAFLTYENILKIDQNNLAANIYMGNYYYLSAETRRKKIDDEYKASTSPTRVKNQDYKKSLNLIYVTDYNTSKQYFENVLRSFPSVEAKRILEKIAQVEKFVQDK